MEHWAARWHTVQPVEAMFGLEHLVAAACFAAETAETAETAGAAAETAAAGAAGLAQGLLPVRPVGRRRALPHGRPPDVRLHLHRRLPNPIIRTK